MDVVEDCLVQNKDKIEKSLVIIGHVAKVLAVTVGQLNPIVEGVFKLVASVLKDPKNEASSYLSQQFQMVNEKLMTVNGEADQISRMLKEASLNKQHFNLETHILSQFEMFQEFVKANPQYRDIKKKNFILQYEHTDRDKNLDDLYNSITEEDLSGCTMLEKVASIYKQDRRAIEDFCVQLKKLFVVGIINVMFYTSLTDQCAVEDSKKKWLYRLEDVEKRMKAAVDDCTKNFAKQAKLDVETYILNNPITISPEVTKVLLDLLVKKYDWVTWSIRVIQEKENFIFCHCLAGENYHSSEGTHRFDSLKEDKIKVAVSFSVSPKPIDKVQIQEYLEQKKLNRNMEEVALALHKKFPDCLVDAVSHCKTMEQANNFPENCYYSGKHGKAILVIHSG